MRHLAGPCLAALALACAPPALLGCGGAREAEARAEVAVPRVAVEVLEVERRPFARRLEVSANVLPRRQEAIVPRVAGRIERVSADEGDSVDEGQELARIDQRDYRLALRQAEANLAAAQANAALAAIGVESAEVAQQRMKTLHETGAIATSAMDKAVDGRRMGEANKLAAEAQVQLARVGLEAARTKVSDTVLRSPFAGVVIRRMLDEGAMCGMSPETSAIMVVADLSRVRVEGSVGERDSTGVRQGMPAVVRLDALPGEVFEGAVELVSPMVDPRSRTSSIRVSVDNDSGRLEPGMAARIEVSLGEREVVALPDDVLDRVAGGERASVFVVDDQGRARLRELRLGARHGSLLEVVEGLEAGERVVRAGQHGLSEGQLVEVRPATAAPVE